MAVFTVLSVDVLPPCELGNRHVAKASLMVDGAAAGTATIANLLAMAEGGDSFVVERAGPPGTNLPATFVLCDCANGHLLEPRGSVDEYPARH